MRRICTICARGGSKGLPGKNLRPILGKSLVAHSIAQARDTGVFQAVAVSSDSADILDEAKKCGADFAVRRPDAFATDQASKLDAIRHATAEVETQTGERFDVIVDLDVTAPLRTVEDILGSIALFDETGATNILTAAPARKSPYFNLVERRPDGSVGLSKPLPGKRIERRQDTPECFDCNAAVYVWRRDVFMERPDVFYEDTQLYVMPEERSHDIDSQLDFDFVEFLMTRRKAG